MLIKKEKELLWTIFSIEVNSSFSKNTVIKDIENAFSIISDFEGKYSRFISDNNLYKLNNNLRKWNSISDEMFYILTIWKDLEELSNNAFSLSVKNVLDSWWYNQNYELDNEFPVKTTWEFLLSKNKSQVFLNSPIEIWAIWKWFVIDKILKIFKQYKNIFINAGWDIYARWTNNDWNKYKAFLEHPTDKDKIIGEIILDDGFLAWSSANKRKWRNKHHLVNMNTIKPANHMLASFVQGDSWILSDGYSTMLYSMWYENA